MLDFEDLKPGETIIRIIRRHWWYFVKLFFQLVGIIIILIISFIFLGFTSVSFLILILLIIIAGLLSLYYWFLWKNDLYILTNERIIDINRNNIFQKSVTEFSLDKIQDVSYQVHGPIPMFIGFGEVIIETAGESQNIKIELAPNPHLIQQQISQAFCNYREKIGHIKINNNTKIINNQSQNSTNIGAQL